MKIFITGYAGTIGRHVYNQIKEGSHNVTTFDLRDGQNVCNLGALRVIMPEDVDIVFHLANIPHPSDNIPVEDYQRINVGGTENLLQACKEKGAKSIVFFSSLAAIGWDAPLKGKNFTVACAEMTGKEDYPIGKPPWPEKTKTLPEDWAIEKYGVSKSIQERLIRESGIKYLILRLGPYGTPGAERGNYYNDAVSQLYVEPVVAKILKDGVKKSNVVHVCQPGMFNTGKLQTFLNG